MAENYREEAADDALETVKYFMEEIVDQIYDQGDAKTDIHDYSDSYHHESHTDRSYSLQEAAQVLDDLGEYEETDTGLWEGLEPRRAIEAQAAYTYGNAVLSEFSRLMEDVNTEATDVADEMRAKLEEKAEEMREEVEDLEDDDPRKEAVEEKIEKMEEALEARAKREIERAVEEAVGIRSKPARGPGPKDWRP